MDMANWRQRWRTYAEVVRISNLPTAWADILCGWLVGRWLQRATSFDAVELVSLLGLLVTSSGLYLSGMAWNDYFDAPQDIRERPTRPIPLGRIRRGSVAVFAASLMLTGLITACWTAWFAGVYTPVYLATALALLILAYDAVLKGSFLGPILLGLCRFGNLLLGAGLIPKPFHPLLLYSASATGLYVLGVSWLARNEVAGVTRSSLRAASSAIIVALGMSAGVIVISAWVTDGEWSAGFPLWHWLLWSVILAGWLLSLARPLLLAMRCPQPSLVQRAVGRSLAGIILLDALLASAIAGPIGYLIVLLIFPTRWLQRFFPPT